MARRPARPLGVLLLVAAAHCGKGAAPASTAPSLASGAEPASAGRPDDGGDAIDPPPHSLEADAWSRAEDGGDDDDARLADLVGCTGLRERGERASSSLRRTAALRAMAYCRDFSELPWLSEIAAGGSDADALRALDAIIEQAARRRRAVDPDDADELHAGCGMLLDLARAKGQPAPRRVRAIRALRMLSERGCVHRAEIPTDLDGQ